MSSSVKTFSFAALICVVCSLLLTATSTGLKERQDYNKKLNVQKHILKVMNISSPGQKYSSQQIEAMYTQNIKDLFITPDGQLTEQLTEAPVHVVIKDNRLVSYALPISGYGLWSTLYGYLAMQGDGATVLGMTIYDHKETPGLGGEAEKPWFQNQFIGKRIVDAAGNFVSVGIVKGKANETVSQEKLINFVDGMSGATITTKGIDKFIKRDLSKYEAFSKRLRG